jgi:hydrogenase nickel incorporation protein HypB
VTTKVIKIEENILRKNEVAASENRRLLLSKKILSLNLLSSPGSGKTTLVVKTIEGLKSDLGMAVIEGDLQTKFDAERVEATGAPVIQINTGSMCHLDARAIKDCLAKLPLDSLSLLLIENVGNLVCPAAFDLGEHKKVVILSVTEGEDKPLKYPPMFRAADVVVVSKVDLLPHVDFDRDRCLSFIEEIAPQARVFEVSSKSGEGLDTWFSWIKEEVGELCSSRNAP